MEPLVDVSKTFGAIFQILLKQAVAKKRRGDYITDPFLCCKSHSCIMSKPANPWRELVHVSLTFWSGWSGCKHLRLHLEPLRVGNNMVFQSELSIFRVSFHYSMWFVWRAVRELKRRSERISGGEKNGHSSGWRRDWTGIHCMHSSSDLMKHPEWFHSVLVLFLDSSWSLVSHGNLVYVGTFVLE